MINLRAVEEQDLQIFQVWRNDRAIRKYFREFRELTIVDQMKWFENLAGNSSIAMFTIEDVQKADDKIGRRPIGCCGLTDIDWFNRCAEVSFYLGSVYVDERAKVPMERLIEIGFKEYGLHRLYAETWAFDTLKADLLIAVGFRHEGTALKAHWYNDSWHDVLRFGLLA